MHHCLKSTKAFETRFLSPCLAKPGGLERKEVEKIYRQRAGWIHSVGENEEKERMNSACYCMDVRLTS